MSEHVRIELLDPKWREQKQRALEKQKDTNIVDKGSIISQNLKRLSEYRTDIFGGDEMAVEKKLKEQKQKALQKEKVVWDGHTASIGSVTHKAAHSMSIEEQIATIHMMKGLVNGAGENAIGPKVPDKTGVVGGLPMPLPPASMQHPLVSMGFDDEELRILKWNFDFVS
ncbi:splicing factor 3a, subunit 1 [Quaeritorhiza haematococci]|nr:splicing factor 3a, subunit 1 [Quaeritorhiza haematococci]